MRIQAKGRIKDKPQGEFYSLEPGEQRTVPDDVGEYWVHNGWAINLDTGEDNEPSRNPVTLNVHPLKIPGWLVRTISESAIKAIKRHAGRQPRSKQKAIAREKYESLIRDGHTPTVQDIDTELKKYGFFAVSKHTIQNWLSIFKK